MPVLESNISEPGAQGSQLSWWPWPGLTAAEEPHGVQGGPALRNYHLTLSPTDGKTETFKWGEIRTSPTAEERSWVSITQCSGPFLIPRQGQESKIWWGC